VRVEVLGCGARGGEIDLRELMRDLARRGWCRVLIEGGAHLAGAALTAGVVDRIAFFAAPILLGAGTPAIEGLGHARVRDAIKLGALEVRQMGPDLLIGANVSRPRRARRAASGGGVLVSFRSR
jgi:diaminohydroxyphosphoribosylaminopyrimidine deaminase/5-amino-6-(5-phosphoribosylamino)uracil reductase